MLLRLSFLLALLSVGIAAFMFVYFQSGELQSGYTGAQQCQTCHQAVSYGGQHQIWQRGPHSGAYTSLQSEQATDYLAANGTVSRKECLACHTTLGREPHSPAEQLLVDEGVGCERCHGAGSSYQYYEVMIDREEFLAKGGIIGSLKDCYQCHAESVSAIISSRCPFQTTDFDAESAWSAISHGVPKMDKTQ